MRKKIIKLASVFLLLYLLIESNYLTALTGQQEVIVIWPYKEIEVFFKDPINNFEELKKLEKLPDRIEGYIKSNPDKVDEFFKEHFNQIDRRRMEIVVFLLSVYPYNILADWGVYFFRQNRSLFMECLEEYENWRCIIAGLTERWEEFYPVLLNLGNSKFGRTVVYFAYDLNKEREFIYQKRKKLKEENLATVAAFLNNPVEYFEQVKKMGDLGFWMDEFDHANVDKNSRILSQLSIDYLFRNHFQQIDEKKIEILFYMLLDGFDGIYLELIGEMVAKTFYSHTALFIDVLKRNENWREIIDSIIVTEWETIMKTLPKLGDSEFEKELKQYILSKSG